MDKTLLVSPSPHITKRHNTTRGIMLHVLIALAPAVIAATVIFGHLVIINVLFCVLFCMGLELLFDIVFVQKSGSKCIKKSTAWDCSSAVTGVILALNLPTFLDIWGLNLKSGGKVVFSFDTIIACLIGSLVAIVLVKMLFGGIGKNFANPAAVGRIFLFAAFASAFSAIYSGVGAAGGLSGVTGATWLGERGAVPLLDMFLGRTNAAAAGETCVIAIAIGYIYLCVMRIVDFRVPLVVVGATLVFVLFFDGFLKYPIHNAISLNAQVLTSPLKNAGDWGEFALRHLMSGGLLFGAVFMCSDYSTTPNTLKGRLVFAAGVGFFTAILRTWAMPEGISFAIVIMNILTPYINMLIRPKFFGAEGKAGNRDKGKKTENSPQPKKREVSTDEK